MGGHQHRVSPPTRALPTHQSHRTYDLGRPAEGGSRGRRPRGLGLRCRRLLKFAPGRCSPTNWKSGQRGREPEPNRPGGGARTLDQGRAESVEGAGRRRERACCHCLSISSVLSASLGKVSGRIAAGTPSLPGHLRSATPTRPRLRPARCPPSPARPGARGAEQITSARAWPAACSRSHRGPNGESGAASGAPPPAALPREGDLSS